MNINTTKGKTMNAVKMIQMRLTNKTDAELLDMGQVSKIDKTTEGRIISAAITEELIARNPQVMDAVNDWSDDLETELDLIDVLADALAA